jgi:uncharacterized protein YbjT (DUF2867 family)
VKIVIIGGTGLIGSKTVTRLRAKGHDVVAASPSTGVSTLTGEGLDAALAGAQVVLDVTNPPSFEDTAILAFFETSSRNLLKAESVAGVRHHVALSVVGTDRLQASGYLRGKLAQERLIESGNIPYTIVRATQFIEFMAGLANAGSADQPIRLSPAYVQPIASDDVADIMVEVALGSPVNGIIEIAGSEQVRLSDLVARVVRAAGDRREVLADPQALYFGAELEERSLLPGDGARIVASRLEERGLA